MSSSCSHTWNFTINPSMSHHSYSQTPEFHNQSFHVAPFPQPQPETSQPILPHHTIPTAAPQNLKTNPSMSHHSCSHTPKLHNQSFHTSPHIFVRTSEGSYQFISSVCSKRQSPHSPHPGPRWTIAVPEPGFLASHAVKQPWADSWCQLLTPASHQGRL